MGLPSTLLATLLAYKVVLLGIGLWASRRSSSGAEFYLAGRGLGPWVASISAAASSSSGFSSYSSKQGLQPSVADNFQQRQTLWQKPCLSPRTLVLRHRETADRDDHLWVGVAMHLEDRVADLADALVGLGCSVRHTHRSVEVVDEVMSD